MKQVVLKLAFADEKIKQKAMKKVSGLSGVESIAMDPKDKKLTVIGDIDPVSAVDKLRKLCQTEIVSVGPAKEPEKPKEQPKVVTEYSKAYQEYYKQQHYDYYYAPSMLYVQPAEPTYYVRSVEEIPNACVIC